MLALACASSPAEGQRIAGHGDDAIQLPKGSWRVRIGGRWDIAADEFTAGGRRSMGDRLRRDSLGVETLPTLAAAEALARRMTGLSALSLSVGQLDARLTQRGIQLPMAVEVGLTRRLAIGVVVPYIETRALPDLQLNPTSETGAFGPNPARLTGFNAAATNNTRTLTTALQTARGTLVQRLADCTRDATSNPSCGTILAERATVDAIIAASAVVREDVRALYGEAVGTGAPVVPVSGSTLDRLIGVRLRGLGKDFTRYGIETVLTGLSPSAARSRYGTGGLQSLLRDTAFGIRNDSLRSVRRYGIGDVDVTASLLLIDQITGANRRPLARFDQATRFAVRSLVEGGWRFGSAGADRPADPFDIPVGVGAPALLVRSSTDILWSARSWVSVTARAVLPQADPVVARVLRSADDIFPVEATTSTLERTVGRSIDLEIAPRHALSQTLGVSALWTWRSRSANRYRRLDSLSTTATTTSLSLDAMNQGTATQQQRVAVGVTYSTLAPFARGRSKHAVELLYEHSEPITGSTGLAATAWDRFEVRWYPGYARR